LFKNIPGKVRILEPKTVYLRLPASYFEPRTIMSVLRKIFDIEEDIKNNEFANGRLDYA